MSPLLREATASNLRALGHIVTECENGQIAIERFKNDNCYDLIITDQAMPHMTGVELAEEVLKIEPNSPIVLCTGYSSKVDSEKASNLGITQYLHKPVRKKEIANVISNLFA
jgi:CheY-like chemotaxis protein